MGQYCTKLAHPTLKHIGTYGEQARKLAFVDSAAKCDLERYRDQDARTPNLALFHSSAEFLIIYS